VIKEILEIVETQIELNIGYHVGDFKHPAESLEGRGWYFGSKIGYLGTGYYYFGSKVDAEKLLQQTKNPFLYQINLTPYRLFKAPNPELFYRDIKQITQLLGNLNGVSLETPEIKESFQELAHIFRTDHQIKLTEDQIINIIKGFVRDVHEKKPGKLLSNRLLEPQGFEGIDNRGVNTLDHYGIGSVLFKIKSGTTKELKRA